MQEREIRKPKLRITEHGVVTTSLAVAEFFEKRHDNVLRVIEALLKSIPPEHSEYRLLNFEETVYMRPNPSGGIPIPAPTYQMTKDGFTLLAMGFTGPKALAWKLRYIQAFNAMQQQLVEQQQALIEQQKRVADQQHRLSSLIGGHQILTIFCVYRMTMNVGMMVGMRQVFNVSARH